MREKRIALAGGGSAGHVNPLLATAKELENRGYDIVVLGTAEGLEAELVPAAGYELVRVPKAPLPRRPSVDWFSLHRRLNQAIKISAGQIRFCQALVGFGGYVSTPAYLGGKQTKTPVVIHEQNVRPGLANRVGARFSAAVALTFSNTRLVSRQGFTEVTGLPLRESIAQLALARQTDAGKRESRVDAAAQLGIDPQRPTLLVTGGSLGAQHLNQEMTKAAGLLPPQVQIIHLTGQGKAAEVTRALEASGMPSNWLVLDYLSQMELALAAADLVVCRSGAGTVAELTALGLPAVYVPLPIGNGEQKLNAASVVEAGGAFLIDDSKFSVATVKNLVFPTLLDERKLQQMGAASHSVAQGDATKKLADLIEAVKIQ